MESEGFPDGIFEEPCEDILEEANLAWGKRASAGFAMPKMGHQHGQKRLIWGHAFRPATPKMPGKMLQRNWLKAEVY